MRVRLPLVVLVLIVNIFTALCQEKGSLTYVIDNTASMSDDIYQVKQHTDSITKIVFDEKASQIKNMVLVTFNDPYAKLAIQTENRNDFKRQIDSVFVTGGGDCEEPSMNGLLLGLEKSLPKSFIYVFTDASSKDHWKSRQVKDLCQKKQSQITFVLTGRCRGLQDQGFQVYYDIANACSGLAFYVPKTQVSEILISMKDYWITENKTMIKAYTAPPFVYTDIPFEIDDQTEYAIVTASGLNVKLSISGPTASQQRIMWLNNAKAIKLINPTAGTYKATVWGHTSTSVYIVGRTDFLFSHGFSALEPKSIKDTTPQPIADAKTHLSILVSDPKHTVVITFAEIMDMNDRVIQQIPLTKVGNDFYTTKAFVAPSKRFKVAVNGNAVRNGQHIRRIAKIPVTPQDPPKVIIQPKKPVVTITEGTHTMVEYGKTIKLTCRVSAYPPPTITWKNSVGTTLVSQSSAIELPYKYISYLTITDATKQDIYSCHAVNARGADVKSIELKVKEPFEIKSPTNGKTELQYGKKGILKCDVSAAVPMHIYWSYEDEKAGVNKQLTSSDKYQISKDGKELTINKMDLNMGGNYICKAILDKDPSKSTVVITHVTVGGLRRPEITGAADKIAIKGTNAVIECNVVGAPQPVITWQFMAKGDSKFVSIEGHDNVLRITGIGEKHAGRYKCIAHNVVGDAEHVTTLTVQVPPKMTSNPSTIYKSIEDKDALMKIPCEATGLPKPVITWKVNGVTITQNEKYSIEDGVLVIKNPQVSDSQTYTCEATNDAGSAYATFQASVLQVPKITGVKEITVRSGESVQMKCNIIKGAPAPTVTWQFMAKDGTNYVPIPNSGNVLHVSAVNKKHSRRYKCIAHNDVGYAEHVTSLIVQFAPKISSNTNMIYKGLEGDIALRIPCDTVGVPQPVITWKVAGTTITPNARYSIVNGALIIKDPKEADSKSYVCEAKNSIGTAKATFQAEVTTDLDDYGTVKEVHVLQGTSKRLECGSDDPNQSVRWFMEGHDLKTNKKYIDIENAEISLEGNYTCRVSDMNGGSTLTYAVIVGHVPVFSFPQEDSTFDWSGSETDTLNCQVESRPLADVVWTYNGKVLSDQHSSVLAVSGKWGEYTCNVSNVHGSVQKTFNVISSKCLISRNPENYLTMPLLLNKELTWPVLTSSDNYLKVPPGQSLTFSCPSDKRVKNRNNSLQKFPAVTEITATCDKQDIFIVDGKPYGLSDLHCAHKIEPVVVKTKQECLTKTSELMRVGFHVRGFLEAYEVCFDTAKNIPLYTRVVMSKSNRGQGVKHNWYKYTGIGDGKSDTAYTCTDDTSSCCYSKAQLVNAADVSDGPAQRSTFIESLNEIPYWRSCESKKDLWGSIEKMIRLQLRRYSQFVAWSGTHQLQEKNGQSVPRYLWKVLRFNEEESIAVVYVNDPSPSEKDFLCTNICVNDNVTWLGDLDENKNIYCCKVDEFLKAFNLQNTSIGGPVDE